MRRFPDQIKAMQWERIQFAGGLKGKGNVLEMGDLFDPAEVRACAETFERAAAPAEGLAAWEIRKESQS